MAAQCVSCAAGADIIQMSFNLQRVKRIIYVASNGKMSVNDKLERMWKWLWLILRYSINLETLRKTMKTFNLNAGSGPN
jgi:hypothetical protein